MSRYRNMYIVLILEISEIRKKKEDDVLLDK